MPSEAKVDQAVDQIATAVRASGKGLSMQLRAVDELPAQIARLHARGVTMISIPLLGLLLREGAALVQTIRGGAA
jgi:hypothetical protein